MATETLTSGAPATPPTETPTEAPAPVDNQTPRDLVENPADELYGEDGLGADDAPKDDNGDGAPKDDNADETKDVDTATVPEEGTPYSLTMPEGVELDSGLMDTVSPLLREKGFTHAEAQQLADAFIESQTAMAETQQTAHQETVDGWETSAREDSEYGGDKFEASVKTAKAALDAYGSKELRTVLDKSGLGSHPEVIRMLVRIGNDIKDDDVPQPGKTGATAKDNSLEAAAADLYGATTPLTNKRR